VQAVRVGREKGGGHKGRKALAVHCLAGSQGHGANGAAMEPALRACKRVSSISVLAFSALRLAPHGECNEGVQVHAAQKAGAVPGLHFTSALRMWDEFLCAVWSSN
jgi:hypothetical protein